MRKITLILMSLCLFIGAASAQTVVTDLNQLSNDKKYFIQSERCFLTCSDSYSVQNKLCTNNGTEVGSITEDYANDKKQQFKIVSNNGKYYLYSVYKEMYIKKDPRPISDDITTKYGVFTSTMDEALSFEQIPGKGEYCWKLKLGNYYMNSQETNQTATGIIIDTWSTTDPGNSYRIIEIEEESLVENGKLYRIKNSCKDLSYLYTTDNDHSNRGDGNGAYLSSTKRVIEGCQFLKSENEYDYKACEIRCDNATLADAGSVWKFEEAANGWKIKNMNNGSYIGATRNGSYVKFEKESDKAAIFSITKSGDYVTLYSADYNNGTNNYLHASGAGLQIWNASSTASHWTIEPATQLEVTVSSADYASIYLPFDVTLPEGENLKAYAVTSTKGGYAKLEKMTTGIPANKGAILEGAGTHTLNIEEATSDWDENLLLGSNVNTYVEGDAFVLANGENGVGLYKAALNKGESGADGDTHFLNNANKAYLQVSSTQGANMLRFDFGGETTGVDAVEVENNVKTIYDLSGRKVSNMSAPGLYIVNGKKVLVK